MIKNCSFTVEVMNIITKNTILKKDAHVIVIPIHFSLHEFRHGQDRKNVDIQLKTTTKLVLGTRLKKSTPTNSMATGCWKTSILLVRGGKKRLRLEKSLFDSITCCGIALQTSRRARQYWRSKFFNCFWGKWCQSKRPEKEYLRWNCRPAVITSKMTNPDFTYQAKLLWPRWRNLRASRRAAGRHWWSRRYALRATFAFPRLPSEQRQLCTVYFTYKRGRNTSFFLVWIHMIVRGSINKITRQ